MHAQGQADEMHLINSGPVAHTVHSVLGIVRRVTDVSAVGMNARLLFTLRAATFLSSVTNVIAGRCSVRNYASFKLVQEFRNWNTNIHFRSMNGLVTRQHHSTHGTND